MARCSDHGPDVYCDICGPYRSLGDQKRKQDGGKNRLSLLPFQALNEVGEVLTYGANKYTPGGWKTVDNAEERYKDALLRHLFAHFNGEQCDSESGLRHLAHVATNALFLLELEKTPHG